MQTVSSPGWNVGTCTTGGRTIASPFKGFSPSGKLRKGELYGSVFASSDEAFKAMRDRGYSQEYRPGPRYFIKLRLPNRVNRHIMENPERRLEIIRAVLPARDWAHFVSIRDILGAERHDLEMYPRLRQIGRAHV